MWYLDIIIVLCVCVTVCVCVPVFCMWFNIHIKILKICFKRIIHKICGHVCLNMVQNIISKCFLTVGVVAFTIVYYSPSLHIVV